MIHADFDALVDPDEHRLGRRLHRLVDHRPLGRAKAAQDVIDGVVPGQIDSDAQPGIVGGAQVALDVAQAVVAAVRAAGPQSQLAQRQVDVIADNQNVLDRQLVEIDQLRGPSGR